MGSLVFISTQIHPDKCLHVRLRALIPSLPPHVLPLLGLLGQMSTLQAPSPGCDRGHISLRPELRQG